MRRRWIEVGLLVVGVAVVVRIIIGIGEGPLVRIAELGAPALAIIVAPHALAVLANARSWWCVIPRERRELVPFTPLVGAWLAGDALNYLLPTATLGGEMTKVRLMRRSVEPTDGVASVTLARMTDLFALVAFGAVGTCCTVALSTAVSSAVLFGGLAGAVALTVALGVAGWRGLFRGAVAVLRRIGPRRNSVRLSSAAERIDAAVRSCFRDDRGALARSTAWRFAGWLVNVFELWIVFRLLGLRGSIVQLVAMEGLIALWNGASFFVPARAGTTEGGWLLVGDVFGFASSDALAIALLRRLRDTVWAVIGLLALAAFSVRKKE